MTHVLVVSCHPRPDSFTAHLVSRATSGLERAGHDVEHLDLYAIDFTTAMSRDEREAYHGDEPVIDPQVAEHIEAVRRAEAIVFVYPTWWAGVPAKLKGWFERVLVPGVGFRFDERSGKIRPNLTHIRRLVGISTYGSPRWYVRLVNDVGRRTITRTVRVACGWRTRTEWHGLYAIDSSDDAARAAFADRVEAAMEALS